MRDFENNNSPPKLTSDPADETSAKERAREGAGGLSQSWRATPRHLWAQGNAREGGILGGFI